MSSECNNIKLAIRNDKSKVVCAMCKQCLITGNHDKHRAHAKKPKNLRSKGRLTSPKPSKLRTYLRWLPTGRTFDLKGKIIASSKSECQSDISEGRLNMLMVRQLGVLKAHDRKSEASNKLWHNLFSVRQFCDSDLEVAFRRNTCFVRSLEGVDLLKGNRTTNLYTINLHDMASASLISLMARATSTKVDQFNSVLTELTESGSESKVKKRNRNEEE
ncbi:hypothetical protein Tco_0889815 [Tanacetum coccineum]